MFEDVEAVPDFIKVENDLLKHWYKNGIIDKYLHKNDKSTKRFSFLDGPITANNPMGVHHAWSRTYKDLWQRFFNMRGYKERFQNGFDCQGLWVEVEVEKEMGFKTKRDIERFGVAEFVQLCKDRVTKYSKVQTEQSKRLAYFMDWDNSYYTMSDENNYMIWYFLKKCHEKGFLYKGRDSVPWCPRCGTAISQHEILTEEYKELAHKTVAVKFPIESRENEFLLAWTTTPWTIPGNVALAVDPKKEYVLAEGAELGSKYYVLKGRAKNFGFKMIKTIKGSRLIGLNYSAPFDDLPKVRGSLKGYKHRVVASDSLILPISEDEGTGIVHVAPGAGSEDFKLGLKEKLPVIEQLDESGVFIDGFNYLSGLSSKEASKLVLEKLREKDLSFSEFDYTHRYPTCWRCRTELVFRVVDEWYIGMDIKDKEDGKTLRSKLIRAAGRINWIPSFGLKRELDWLNDMHDWLVSKKRYWGLALPIWECEKCGNFEVIGGYDELKERAISGWDQFEGHSPHKPYIDKVLIKCGRCKSVMSRVPDVGNPWLDAGIVPFSTLVDPTSGKVSYLGDKSYWKDWFPADFITESFPGQFKNWFYSLIAMSAVLENTNPAKTVLGFATMVDEKGIPFHKSAGNSIDFIEGADKFSADIIRFICLAQNPAQDILFGSNYVNSVRKQFYLIFWNSYKFFVTYAKLDNFSPNKVSLKDLSTLDKWILSKLNSLLLVMDRSLLKYDASSAAKALQDFVVNSLSTWYIRRVRDNVGPSAVNGEDKVRTYSVLYIVLVTLTKLAAPFMPFISEEMYMNLSGKKESVHLEDWPKADKYLIDKSLEEDMGKARSVVEKVHSWRKLNNYRVRMPLKEVVYVTPKKFSEPIENIIKDETNVKILLWKSGEEVAVDVVDTGENDPMIKAEGFARDMVREIQDLRKSKGCNFDDKVCVDYPTRDDTLLALKYFEDYIKRAALVAEFKESDRYALC